MTSLALLIILGYIAICVYLTLQQDSMIFFPSRASEGELDAIAAIEGFEPWLNEKGERIGWQSRKGDPTHALLICHGNGGYALHRNYYAYRSREGSGVELKTYLLEYPGYGARPGKPSEESLIAAALEAVDVLRRSPGVRIFVVGQSLGTGVASAIAGKRKDAVQGLVLVTPFRSLVGTAQFRYPWLPVSMFLLHRFESETHLEDYPGPVAFILAEQDTIVPAKLGKELYDAYPGKKRLWNVQGAEHNDMEMLLSDWPAVLDWLEENSPAPQTIATSGRS